MGECIFCAEIETRDSNIFIRSRNGLLAARWDKFPVVPGHVEVIPIRHVQYLKDLTPDEQAELMVFAAAVVQVIDSTNLGLVYEQLRGKITDKMSVELIEKADAKLHEYAGRKPDAHTFGVNDGPAAGQSVGHMHLHIMPRWEGDMTNPRGGVRNIFAGDLYSRAE